MGSPDDFGVGLDSARSALRRGDRREGDRLLREAIALAESGTAGEVALPMALVELAALRFLLDDAQEAEALFERARATLESMAVPDNAMLFAALSGLAGVMSSRGDSFQTQQVLARALHVADRFMASDHPEVVRVLGDLSRLSLKHGAYGAAEPLLVRLYDVKCRSKGEDHPEAATVLASLATVRQALGRHDEAESMWRRVLDVRERTLAPNHFATATSLQHLAEACAARGKLGEALRLLRRATTMRELTMGSNHPSVRIARDRIADLELQASDDAPDVALDVAPFVAPFVAPVVAPVVATDFSPDDAPDIAIEPPARRPMPTARPDMGESQAYTMLLALQEQSATRVAPSPVMPTREALVAEQKFEEFEEFEEFEQTEHSESVSERARVLLATTAATFHRQRLPVAVASAVAAVLLLGLVATRSRASSDVGAPDMAMSSTRAASTPIVSAPSAASAMASSSMLSTAGAGASSSTTMAARPVTPALAERKAVRPSAAPTTTEAPDRADSRAIVMPTFSRQQFSRIDSFARSVKAPAIVVDEAFPVKLAADLPATTLGAVSTPDASGDFVRARLISRPTQPRFPESLRGRKVEGDVAVRFIVDAMGRPDLSTVTVVRTPHELMTDAVRLVLPSMRFAPARSSEGRAERDEVEVSFQFRRGAKQ